MPATARKSIEGASRYGVELGRRDLSALSFFLSVSAIQMACAGTEGAKLAYVLNIFPIVARKNEAGYGKYRTKWTILETYERLEFLK